MAELELKGRHCLNRPVQVSDAVIRRSLRWPVHRQELVIYQISEKKVKSFLRGSLVLA